MTPEEYEALGEIWQDNRIKGSELENQEDRLLLSGYTKERDDFEVHLYNGRLRVTISNISNVWTTNEPEDGFEPQDLVPDKRTYIKNSEFEFCALIKRRGQAISFA